MSDQRYGGAGQSQPDDRIRRPPAGGPVEGTEVSSTAATGSSHARIVGSQGEGGEGAGAEHASGAELEQRFVNPGLPAHVYRRADVDPVAAKRREREVAALFGLSTLGTLLFIVAYFAVNPRGTEGNEMLSTVSLSTKLLGLGLGLSLFGIGAAAIHWAKTLMPDDEVVAPRKPMRSPDAERAEAVAALKEGAAGAGLGRRKLIRNSMLGALAPLGLLAIIPLRDLGPLPEAKLTATIWKPGRRVVTDPTGRPLKPSDIAIGGVIHVQPEGIDELGHEVLNEKAKATTILIRLEPDEIKSQKERDWSVDGIVAYSKVCTHLGCPVGLYEQQTHHLLCPCHQSTFDVTRDCTVIFGPAARPLPQLPLAVDDEGYLVSREDYHEPVGPSYWERG